MNKSNYFKRIGIVLFIWLLALSRGYAAEFKIMPKPQKISEHVYAWIGPHGGPDVQNKGYRMNLAFVVGKEAIAVLDSGFYPAMAQEMLGRIREISSLPIRYVINSNSRPDRYFGNDVFAQMGAKIIAHENEIAYMREVMNNHALFIESSMKFKVDTIKIPALPNMPIKDKIELDLGGNVFLKISSYKSAHTPAPLVVHVPGDKLVYAGDILYSGRLLAAVPGGNIRQWIETFDYLRGFGDVTFIPGHGKPGGLQTFEKSTYSYLKLLDKYMTQMVSDGVDMNDAIKKIRPYQEPYRYLENFVQLAGRNAQRAYQEAELASFE